MKTYDFLTALRKIKTGKGLCMRPPEFVNTGNGFMITVLNGRVEPGINLVKSLLSEWVICTIDSVEKEKMEYDTGIH